MTDQQHPITPPPELVKKWANASARTHRENGTYAQLEFALATQAARWGADQQLEQDAKWLDTNALFSRNLTISPSGNALRKEMRPKPPSLKEQALEMLECIPTYDSGGRPNGIDVSIIRRALEQLND